MSKDIDLEKRYYPVKFKKQEENPDVIKFAAIQSNFADAVRYLIEKEIAQNGIRDLSNFIPQKRTKEYFKALLNSNRDAVINEISIEKVEPVLINSITQNDRVYDDEKEIDDVEIVEKGNEGTKYELDNNSFDFKEKESQLTIDKQEEDSNDSVEEVNEDEEVDEDVLACYMQ